MQGYINVSVVLFGGGGRGKFQGIKTGKNLDGRIGERGKEDIVKERGKGVIFIT